VFADFHTLISYSLVKGMNVNVRELGNHVEFEPNTYYAAFSGELEASACAMWALALHLKDDETLSHTRRLLDHCFSAVRTWFDAVGFTDPDNVSCIYLFNFYIGKFFYFRWRTKKN